MEASHNKKSNNKCLECDAGFVNISNLRRHVKKFHPTKINELAPQLYKNPENFNFSCQVCNKNFSHSRNFECHIKTHCPSKERSDYFKNCSKKCAMCTYTHSHKNNMLSHFKETHDIFIKSKKLQFSSWENFEKWKDNVEHNSHSKFAKRKIQKFKIYNMIIYECHRSGNYISESKGHKNLKTQGSCKINAYCPAGIKICIYSNGKCDAIFCETHVGHEADIGHLHLTLHERQELASKIALKIPFNDILDEVRNSVSDSKLERIHLLTRKDLSNIELSFNLSSYAVKHPNGGRELPSSSTKEIYVVKENNKGCSCIDSSIKFNMCKHIHLVAKRREDNGELSNICGKVTTDDEQDALFIHDDENYSGETSITLKEVSNKRNTSFEEEKQKIKTKFLNKLDSIESPTELEIMKKILQPLYSPTFEALNTKRSLPVPSKADSQTGKISVQRLFSTKKKHCRNNTIKKPSAEEIDSLAVSLLLKDNFV